VFSACAPRATRSTQATSSKRTPADAYARAEELHTIHCQNPVVVVLYEEACAGGIYEACDAVAITWAAGACGVPIDNRRALQFHVKACIEGKLSKSCNTALSHCHTWFNKKTDPYRCPTDLLVQLQLGTSDWADVMGAYEELLLQACEPARKSPGKATSDACVAAYRDLVGKVKTHKIPPDEPIEGLPPPEQHPTPAERQQGETAMLHLMCQHVEEAHAPKDCEKVPRSDEEE
jgi:hypothetical protein